MDAVAEKKRVHQGNNVQQIRRHLKLSQEDVATKMGIDQAKYSRTVEQNEIIDDEVLKQVAEALEFPVRFIKEFDLVEASKVYYNNSTHNAAENSHEIVNQGQGQENIVYNYPIEQLTAFADKFLGMQQAHYEKEQTIINNFHQKEITLVKDAAEKDKKIALLELRLELLDGKK